MAIHFAKPDRREMLRNLGLGLLGTSCASWLPTLGGRSCPRSAPPPALHPAVDERRSEPDRYVRHETRACQRRRIQRAHDQRPRTALQRALAEAGQTCRSARDRPLAEHQGRRPRPRHAPGPHRPFADGRCGLSVDCVCTRQGTYRPRRCCRTTSPSRRRAISIRPRSSRAFWDQAMRRPSSPATRPPRRRKRLPHRRNWSI